MPPERLEGAEATTSGDLFALGCVLYELLSGDLPEISVDGIQLPRLERPDAPAAYPLLERVLGIALHPDPKRRFPDARAFQRGLDPVRQALPAVELASWLREAFADRWARERELLELSDPTPAEVEALRARELPTAPGGAAETTQIMEPRAAPPVQEQKTRLNPRPPGGQRR
jgi:serine/threonine protein kinase